MKEMTYLFVSIALGLVTAVSRGRFDAAGVSAVLLAATFLLDSGLVSRKELHKDLRYERIEMIKPEWSLINRFGSRQLCGIRWAFVT